MELKLTKREISKKSELGRIRREGGIPAVVYLRKGPSVPVFLRADVFQAHLRAITKGCLATAFFNVEFEGKKFKALVKDITYHRTTYDIQHIDLMQVEDSDRITVHIPVVCKGVDQCVGVTQGGQLKKVKRSVKVSVTVAEMPSVFELDVTGLELDKSLRVRDIAFSPSIRPRLQEHQILVAVSK